MSKVAILRSTKIKDTVRKSVELVGGLSLKGDEHVIIKPNIANGKNPYGMVITDFTLIETIVEMIKEKGNEITVVESDNISAAAEKRVNQCGLQEKLDEWDVPFLNLSHDDYEEHEIAGTTLRMPKTVMDADYFINLPKIKTCAHTHVTLSIKNLYGVFQRAKKGRLHKKLDIILPYLAKVVRNDLIVVDGLTCMEGNGPVVGNPCELGVIVAGINPVSVDAMCSRLMGYDPKEIPHIQGSYELGLGEINLEKIFLLGDEWVEFVHEFERPYSLKATLKTMKSLKDTYLTR